MEQKIIDYSTLTIGERLKLIRKKLNITQPEMAKQLGTSKQNICAYEHGSRNIPEYMIKSFCKNYQIEYSFFKFGQGEMFQTTTEPLISAIQNEYDLDDLDILIIKEYMKLKPEHKSIIKTYLAKIAQSPLLEEYK